MIEGLDEIIVQVMQVCYVWVYGEICWCYCYVDLMYDEDGIMYIDYMYFYEVVLIDVDMDECGLLGVVIDVDVLLLGLVVQV